MDKEQGQPDYTTVKILKRTRKLLRQIAAATEETMLEVMDRLARDEWRRLDNKKDRETK